MPAPTVQILLDFQDETVSDEKQEKLTQTLYQQIRKIDGVNVDRVPDPNPPEGSRGFSFLWGLLKLEVNLENSKKLFGFLGDRIGDKPIKIKAKFADGREYELEARSREELKAAEEAIERLAQVK